MGRPTKIVRRALASEFDADPAAIRFDLDALIKELTHHELMVVAASERAERALAHAMNPTAVIPRFSFRTQL
jgi:hypothetical protein